MIDASYQLNECSCNVWVNVWVIYDWCMHTCTCMEMNAYAFQIVVDTI